MTDLDQFRAELAGTLAGLSPSQRLKAGREMADRLAKVLAAIERGEIDASATETRTVARRGGGAGDPHRVTPSDNVQQTDVFQTPARSGYDLG